MTKDVYITVRGIHTMDGTASDPVEVRTRGRYYYRGGRHYLLYEEEPEGTGQKISSMLKFDEKTLEVHKKGGVESVMLFEPDQLHVAHYHTPAGVLEMGVKTEGLDVCESGNRIEVSVHYSLHAGGSRIQDSEVIITAVPYPIV